jgi:kynurenine formamidase
MVVGLLNYLPIIAWVDKGGIIGRGILIDWYAWSKRNNKNLSPFETGAVHLADVMTILAETSVQPRQGDILFIRTGFTAAYNKLSLSEQQAFPDRKPGGLLGLEATRDSLRWIWESGFAAIAGDAPGFERGPATGSYNDPDISVHQWALAGWGLPIGEMFDLEELAQACTSRQRWTFFLTSVPLNV